MSSKERFVNPYNFIPLADECKRWIPQINEEDCYTGYFDCSMSLLTPLFIPNTSSSVRLLRKDEVEEGHKGYDFFSYDNWSKEGAYEVAPPVPPREPVIPGSEIRGAVRSVYEAAFNGCMSSVNGSRELSRRCTPPKTPGILKWDEKDKEWHLERCQKARLSVEQKGTKKNVKCFVERSVYNDWKEGQEIWVKYDRQYLVEDYAVISGSEREKEAQRKRLREKKYWRGYLHKGECGHKKHCEAIFCVNDKGWKKTPIKVRNEDIDLLKRVLKEYRDATKNQKAKGKKWYAEYEILKEGTLVYYAKAREGHVYMCPACIGREAYTKTINSLLEKNGGYQPCSGKELCPACQIFGMMEKAEKPGTYAYASKLRITDAKLIKKVKDSSSLFEEPMVLPELGEPRPSAVEFYTESPYKKGEIISVEKKGYWTYDYKYTYKKKDPERILLDEGQPKIRGRKYYWHSEVDIEQYKNNQVNKMRQRIRPMRPNEPSDSQPMFQFRIYFEELNKKQLSQLKWALDFGNSECAHKIGRAKPLGFGSVRIQADRLQIRRIDEETGRWEIRRIGESETLSFQEFFGKDYYVNNGIPEALKIMTNWESRPENVRYPIGEKEGSGGASKENATASHQWFRANKNEDRFRDNFSKVLPTAKEDASGELEENKALYRIEKK